MEERGAINLYLGTMFSGKTKRAMVDLKPLIDSGATYVLFQSSWNKRDGAVWKSRSLDFELPAQVIDVRNPNFVIEMARRAEGIDIVGIDEPFSFVSYKTPEEYEQRMEDCASRLAALVSGWRESGKKVYIPTISVFFNKRPIPFVSRIYGYATAVETCSEAVCNLCGKPAGLTQRTHNNIPSRRNEPLLVLDGEEGWDYFPVCAEHYKLN